MSEIQARSAMDADFITPSAKLKRNSNALPLLYYAPASLDLSIDSFDSFGGFDQDGLK